MSSRSPKSSRGWQQYAVMSTPPCGLRGVNRCDMRSKRHALDPGCGTSCTFGSRWPSRKWLRCGFTVLGGGTTCSTSGTAKRTASAARIDRGPDNERGILRDDGTATRQTKASYERVGGSNPRVDLMSFATANEARAAGLRAWHRPAAGGSLPAAAQRSARGSARQLPRRFACPRSRERRINGARREAGSSTGIP